MIQCRGKGSRGDSGNGVGNGKTAPGDSLGGFLTEMGLSWGALRCCSPWRGSGKFQNSPDCEDALGQAGRFPSPPHQGQLRGRWAWVGLAFLSCALGDISLLYPKLPDWKGKGERRIAKYSLIPLSKHQHLRNLIVS